MRILTNRHVATWPSYQIVWEWEDVLSQILGVNLIYDSKILLNKWIQYLNLFQGMRIPKGNIFLFEVSVSRDDKDRRYNQANILPCVVDYFFKDEELNLFEKKFCNNPLVYISSKEVYDRLHNLGCGIPICHLPLTLPDKYELKPNTIFDKKYDLIMMGRQNPVLSEYLNDYILSHPDFVYVYEKLDVGKFHYYTSTGEYVGYIETRDKYMSLLRQSKVAMYSTPGIDGGEVRTNGFNQVTPKFLEYLASGCNVICRWKDNPDTDFYQLKTFGPNIDSYKTFERQMDEARRRPVDMSRYVDYLKPHYTSSIADILSNSSKQFLGE